MKGSIRLTLMSALFILGSSLSAIASAEPLVLTPISEGSPVHMDQYGNMWWCSAGSRVCVPLETSEPPIE